MISCTSEKHLSAAQRLVTGFKDHPLLHSCTSQLVIRPSLLVKKCRGICSAKVNKHTLPPHTKTEQQQKQTNRKIIYLDSSLSGTDFLMKVDLSRMSELLRNPLILALQCSKVW